MPLSTHLDNTSAKFGGGGKGKHFILEREGTSLAFCYIRKNASTAFKRFFMGESPFKSRASETSSDYAFLQKFHSAKLNKLTNADKKLLILRDPLTRVAAVYRNKFVQRDGNSGIFSDFANKTGRDPAETSFSDFVTLYLFKARQNDLSDLDKHLWPQASHLAKVDYDTVLPMENLHAVISNIISQEVANKYFLQVTNSSISASAPGSNTWMGDIPASRLRTEWEHRGALPRDDQLFNKMLHDRLKELYAQDLQLVREVTSKLG